MRLYHTTYFHLVLNFSFQCSEAWTNICFKSHHSFPFNCVQLCKDLSNKELLKMVTFHLSLKPKSLMRDKYYVQECLYNFCYLSILQHNSYRINLNNMFVLLLWGGEKLKSSTFLSYRNNSYFVTDQKMQQM